MDSVVEVAMARSPNVMIMTADGRMSAHAGASAIDRTSALASSLAHPCQLFSEVVGGQCLFLLYLSGHK